MTLMSFLPVLLRGALVTLEVTASSGVIAFLLAMLVGTAQLSRVAVVRTAAKAYVEILRGTSALIQLFYLFFVLPVLGIDITPMEAAAFGLGLTFSAYGAEIVRAGILSVDRGQWDAARALEREIEIRDLYTFSQRLSAAHSPAAIFEAMQQHLGTLVGRKVLLFDSLGTLEAKSERLGDVEIPRAVSEAVGKMQQTTGGDRSKGLVVNERGSAWLVRPVSVNAADFGVIAVDLGRRSESLEDLRARVVALISDAGLSLERLGLARTIAEARTRAETEQFREALIGSVSHELRTPLSSILGASTVLSLAPEVTGNARLKNLAALIHQESERLNVEIQNILDASRISSNGLQVKLEWAEPADFVNAALQRCRNRLATRKVEVTLPDELVLLRIDSVLMERALGQILDNAAKYSPPDSAINVRGRQEDGQFAIAVTDEGAGLDPDDRALLGQKFFRGSRHSSVTSGLGLGFWIASAFIAANNGTIEATSEGANKGTTVTIRLPLAMNDKPEGLT